jgi:UDP-glucose 4-epimerase
MMKGVSVKEVIEAGGSPALPLQRRSNLGERAILRSWWQAPNARDVLRWEPKQADLDEIVASGWKWHQRRLAPRDFCISLGAASEWVSAC